MFIEMIIGLFVIAGFLIALSHHNKTKQQRSIEPQPSVEEKYDKRSDVPVLILNNLNTVKKKKTLVKVIPQEIIVGQFKTDYFFEENIKLLREHDLHPQYRTLSNGHRQIFLKVSGSMEKIVKQLNTYKSLKIVPKDAFIKAY